MITISAYRPFLFHCKPSQLKACNLGLETKDLQWFASNQYCTQVYRKKPTSRARARVPMIIFCQVIFNQTQKLGCYNIIWDKNMYTWGKHNYFDTPIRSNRHLWNIVWKSLSTWGKTVYRQTRVKPNVSHFSLGKGVWSMRSIISNSLCTVSCLLASQARSDGKTLSKRPEPARYCKYGLWWHD